MGIFTRKKMAEYDPVFPEIKHYDYLRIKS